jgi:PKD repeat protein
LVLGLIGLAGMVVAVPLQVGAAPTYVTTQGSQIMYQGRAIALRGVNFNNEPALGLTCTGCGASDINLINANQSDYAQAHQLGANHLRWGIDYNWYAANRTQFFSVLDQHMAWAAQYQLWVYLVDFIPPGGSTGGFDQRYPANCIWSDCPTSGTNQNLLNAMWQDIATHYANNPTILGYDVMNEPAPPNDSEWATLATRLYTTITAADPNHLVIIEAPLSNDLSQFTQTSRVVYSVHNYPGGDNYPTGTPANTPLIVGEFGDQRTSATAVSFVTTEISRYNAAGVNWTYFVWREDPAGFGLYVDPAGDFTQPWPGMISAVQTGWAGNVEPAAIGGPSPSPSPSPSAGPSPSPTPPPSPPPSGTVPTYDHIVQILMENRSYNEVIGQPYIASLAKQGAVAGSYFAVDHPSLPNYLALTSGQDPAFASSDCAPAPGCNLSSTNLADTIEAAGKTWKSYSESMGTPCRQDGDSLYDANHNPFVYFTDITGNATRCNSHVVDYSNLAGDLSSTSTTPNYVFIDPNLQDNMHDGSIAQGDTWLSQNVPAILSSPAFTQQHSLLIVMWDEDDSSQNNQVAFIADGFGVKTGFVSSVQYTHYSWLRTIEASWGLSTLTANDGAASPMTDLFGTSSSPALSVSTSASSTSGTAPASINFTSSVSGGTAPYTYAWTFGDTGTATAQNPSHTYAAAGTYSVHLTVTDSASHTATASAITITVNGALSASASASPRAGDAPLTVAFTGSGSGGTPPYGYSWAFGDGATAATQNPSHSYSTAGTYTATLTTTDASVGRATATVAVVVSPSPTAGASASVTSGAAPLTVNFTGSTTGGLAPFTYSWTFGDGTGSTILSPTHTYAAAGTYTAILGATDANNVRANAPPITVTVTPALGVITSVLPAAGDAPLSVNFTGTPSGGTSPYNFAWTFGDGTTSTSQSPTHTYAGAGTYSATLTVTDGLGARAVAGALTITVNQLPAAAAGANRTSGDAPVTVNFTGSVTGGTAPFSYSWNFGDGTSAVGQNPIHTYTAAGTYGPTLTVTDAAGHSASTSAPAITVSPALSVSDAETGGTNAPAAVSFTSTPSGGLAPYTYAWTFGDGTVGIGQNPTHTYTTAGIYTANLTVTDANGATASAAALTITIHGPLAATAGASPLAGDAPLTVAFTGRAAGGSPSYGYSWTFGDGTGSTSQNPSHVYSGAGTFTATLTVTDAAGATATATVTTVVSPSLLAGASANVTTGAAPLTVDFSGTTTGGLGPFIYAWNFGDGQTSPAQNPTHTFAAAGTYTVSLTVTDANLARASAAPLTISVFVPLSATASSGPRSGDAPFDVAFSGAAAGGVGPYGYAWNFGDGATSTAQNPSHTYSSPGTYSVGLTVTDSGARTATATAITISVSPALSVGDSASATGGDAPLAVNFTSAPSGGLAPYAYVWTFGDGTSATAQNPSHTYTSAGSYSVSLTVTDANGVKATANALTITVQGALSATAGVSTLAGDAPLAVNFTGTSAGGTAPFSYAWTFGDATGSSSQNPSHVYSVAGTYNVTLRVTDAAGVAALANTLTITANPLPAASAAADRSQGDAPLIVGFTGTVTGGTAPFSFAWSFGDGATSTAQSPGHTYTAAGTYSANLTLTDALGNSVSATALSISVSPALTVVDGATPGSGRAPLAVSFASTPTGGLPPYSYTWTFGDTSTGTGQSPSHTYTTAGTYSVQLTVTDANGATAGATALSIPVIGLLTAAASATPGTGDAPLTTKLNGSITGGQAPYSFMWDLGDGTSSTSQSPSHDYSGAGTYTASLTVSDGSGQLSHASVNVTVYPAMSISVSASPTSGAAPLQVDFTGSASGGLAPYVFTWHYGDGATGSGLGAAHSYSAGTFLPTLTVRDAAGGTWTGTAGTISVTSPPVIPTSTSGGGNQQPVPPSAPAASSPSPSPSVQPSPSGEPSATPPAGPAVNQQNSPRGGGGPGPLPLLLMLLGSVFATGLGGSLFLRWLRLRS